jgi:hypothetical protein
MASSAYSSDSDEELDPPQPVSAAVLQTVNIRSHVSVLIEFDDSNYSQWRCFFESVLGKFGITDHVRSPPPLAQRSAEWRQVDHCIVNWLYNTIKKPVFDIVHKPHTSAFTLWGDIEALFRDNELQRAVYLEAEFRSIQQGDLSINDYCTKLKRLADNLRDVGHPVSETSQVLNLLRGLSPRYRHVKPVITGKSPPHTFMSARSYLLLEEASDDHEAKTRTGLALYAGCGGSSPGSGATSGDSGSRSGSGGGFSTNRSKKSKSRSKGGSSFNSGGAPSSGNGSGAATLPQCPPSSP